MSAAFDSGGTVVGVLADALDARLRQPDIRRAIGEDRLTLLTPFKPDAGFSVASAMGRNKVVYGLSKVTLVVASDLDKGGTWQGAVEAIRRRYGRVAVWRGEGEGPGNAALVARGGIAVTSMDELNALVSSDAPTRDAEPGQLSFGA